MARRTTRKTKRPAGVTLDAYLGKQLADPEFRHHLEQRRLVHEVAIVVRSMREQAGLTQAQLAKVVGVSQPMVARMERGLDQRTPRWETLRKIGLALGKQLKLSCTSGASSSGRSHPGSTRLRRAGRRSGRRAGQGDAPQGRHPHRT